MKKLLPILVVVMFFVASGTSYYAYSLYKDSNNIESINNEVIKAEAVENNIESDNKDESLNYKSVEDYEKAQRTERQIIELYEEGDYDTLFLHYKNMFIDTVNKIEPTRKTREIYNEAAKNVIEESDDYDTATTVGINFSLLNKDVLALFDSKFGKESAEKKKELAEFAKKREQERAEIEAKYEVERKELEAEREKYERSQQGVRIGMTQEEVLMSSWGKPEDINKTTTAYGTSEQWVYRTGNYLYFDDGILTSIQN